MFRPRGVFGYLCCMYMFGYMQYFGMVPDHIDMLAGMTSDEFTERWKLGVNARNPFALPSYTPPPKERYQHCEQPLVTDYVVKQKTDEFKRQDFHLIRHAKINNMLLPVALAGLSFVWYLVDQFDYVTTPIWKYLFWASVATASFNFITLFLRFVYYPKKFMKEVYCPERSNIFITIPLMFVMWSILATNDEERELRFWLGAPLIAFGAVWQLSRYVHRSLSVIVINMVNLFPAIACLIVPLVVCNQDLADGDYCEFGFFFFGTGVGLVLLFTFQCFTLWTAFNPKALTSNV
eukprot:UN06042